MATSSETKEAIEQIREILVGAVQRDLERKLARVEAHLSARVGEIQQETRRRTDVIEAHLRKEVDALGSRVEAELVELKDGLRALTRDHRETNSAFDQRVAKVEETVARGHHDLRAQILEQAKSFLDELQHVREELAETIERELDAFELAPVAEQSERREHELESPAP